MWTAKPRNKREPNWAKTKMSRQEDRLINEIQGGRTCLEWDTPELGKYRYPRPTLAATRQQIERVEAAVENARRRRAAILHDEDLFDLEMAAMGVS